MVVLVCENGLRKEIIHLNKYVFGSVTGRVFKQRIAEKILNNLCGTSFINGLVGMPYKENSKSAFKLQ